MSSFLFANKRKSPPTPTISDNIKDTKHTQLVYPLPCLVFAFATPASQSAKSVFHAWLIGITLHCIVVSEQGKRTSHAGGTFFAQPYDILLHLLLLLTAHMSLFGRHYLTRSHTKTLLNNASIRESAL